MRFRPLVAGFTAVVVGLIPAAPALAQSAASAEIDALRQEMRRLQERLQKLEQAQTSAPGTVTVQAPAPPPPGEREITMEREHIFERFGLPKPEVAGVRFSGFFVAAANYNSHTQMVPEFAGNAPVSSEPRRTDFRFEQFSLGVNKTLAPWLSAGASVEIERHAHRHAHGFSPGFGCPGVARCVEQFGAEPIETEVSLHRFHITAVAPIGNGLALSFGRFDTPYGYERHDAALNLTATISEVQSFGRPQSMTGFQAAYQFAPWLDIVGWFVNRWENETTEDPFEDNNRDKSFGGRLGFTPIASGNQLLNFGLGGWFGPERANNDRHNRWIIDFDATWTTPVPGLLLAAEFVYGGEQTVSFRRRGEPYADGALFQEDVNWLGLYALAHYDIAKWLGLTFRYGLFKDYDAARTGVKQTLQSFTIAPIVHLSRLIPDLRPLGVTYARTRHPLDWVDIRLEYRLNHSDKPVFADVGPGIPRPNGTTDHESHQLTLQFVVNY
jgi:hypothetical protein